MSNKGVCRTDWIGPHGTIYLKICNPLKLLYLDRYFQYPLNVFRGTSLWSTCHKCCRTLLLRCITRGYGRLREPYSSYNNARKISDTATQIARLSYLRFFFLTSKQRGLLCGLIHCLCLVISWYITFVTLEKNINSKQIRRRKKKYWNKKCWTSH